MKLYKTDDKYNIRLVMKMKLYKTDDEFNITMEVEFNLITWCECN